MKSKSNNFNKKMGGNKHLFFPLNRYLLVPFISIIFLSSCNYLSVDEYFTDELKSDSVFANKRYIEAYMWQAASMFPNEVEIWRNNYTPGELATD